MSRDESDTSPNGAVESDSPESPGSGEPDRSGDRDEGEKLDGSGEPDGSEKLDGGEKPHGSEKSADADTIDWTEVFESDLLRAVAVLFDGLLAGVFAVAVVRTTLGTRPLNLPTGASTLGVVLLATLLFACGVALNYRAQLADRGDALLVNAPIGAATVFAASLILLPAAGVDLQNWRLPVAEPFLGFVLGSVVLVFGLLFVAFASALSDPRLILRRGAGASIDGLLALLVTYVLVWRVMPLVWRHPPTGATEGEVVGLFLTLLCCSALVRIPFEAYNGRSVGKYATGIRVIDGAGGSPAFSQVVVRNFLRPVDSLPFAYVLGVGWASAEDDGRRLGDTLAGTAVVRVA